MTDERRSGDDRRAESRDGSDRRGGRPPRPDGLRIPVSASVSADTFDAVCRLAAKREQSVSSLVREAILRLLADEPAPLRAEFR